SPLHLCLPLPPYRAVAPLELHSFPTRRSSDLKLEVVPPPQEVSSELEISPFEPTIFITSCGRLESGEPVEYTESYYPAGSRIIRSEEHTSELQSRFDLVCRLLLEKNNRQNTPN